MEKYNLFIGTYTDDCDSRGVYSIAFDSHKENLQLLGASDAGSNPSFLALHENGKFLYTANEVADTGRVVAYAIAKDGISLDKIDVVDIPGSFTCHVTMHNNKKYLYGANYGSGNIFSLALTEDGYFKGPTAICQHEGYGPDINRQEGPHAHSTGITPDGNYVIAADLGCDELRIYSIEKNGGLTLVRIVSTPAGEGPRHFVFHPNKPLLYVLTELANHLLTYRWDLPGKKLELIDSKSTLPKDFAGESFAADIHLTPDARFLYASNRGHNSLTIFSLDENGLPTFCITTDCGGKFPRNFWISPTGSHILVANQDSNNIVAFPRDDQTGLLGPAVATIEIPKPVCIIHRNK